MSNEMVDTSELVLEIKGASKAFPGVQALTNVDFTLRKGEIHSLVGENGAGKSTLIKLMTGVHKPDTGAVFLNGKKIEPSGPLDAQGLGIATVYQEVNLVPNLSVAENLFLGRQPTKAGRIDWKSLNENARTRLQEFELEHLDVEENLGRYSVAIQQLIAIARALELDSNVLILDEPTSSLNIAETQQLFRQMRRLRSEGRSIIFITHFLDQVFEVSDRVTVLRNGHYVGTYLEKDITRDQLVGKLLGKELDDVTEIAERRREIEEQIEAQQASDAVVQARDLGSRGGPKPFSMDIRRGEVVGLAGLLGSGRTETANLFFGVDSADQGSVVVNGNEQKIDSPRKAVNLGIGMSPEDRKAQGIVEDLTVRENIILALQSRYGWFKRVPAAEQSRIAQKYIDMLDIRTPTAEQVVKNLSGGNQQKVIIARWLAANPQFLILDEPTRGIDVGAKTEVQNLIIDLSEQEMGILFISSEIEEVARCSTKVMVMHDFSVADRLYGDDIQEDVITQSIARRHVSDAS